MPRASKRKKYEERHLRLMGHCFAICRGNPVLWPDSLKRWFKAQGYVITKQLTIPALVEWLAYDSDSPNMVDDPETNDYFDRLLGHYSRWGGNPRVGTPDFEVLTILAYSGFLVVPKSPPSAMTRPAEYPEILQNSGYRITNPKELLHQLQYGRPIPE
ncbi:MAG: hypothetical protein AAGJ95_13965 [Cyanobacteria bacterium J06554_11]